SAAMTLRPKILTRACRTILRSTTPITRIHIGGRIRNNLWSGRRLLVRPAASSARAERGLVPGPHHLNGLAIHPGLINVPLHDWQRTYETDILVGTGPAAEQVFNLSSDGLGNKIIGTGFNCSRGVTPWGTVLSAEENFQGSVARFPSGPNVGEINLTSSFYIGVQEQVKPDGTQLDYIADTTGAEFGQVGEKYGWLVE